MHQEAKDLLLANPTKSRMILDMIIETRQFNIDYIVLGVLNGQLCPVMGDTNKYELIFSVKI